MPSKLELSFESGLKLDCLTKNNLPKPFNKWMHGSFEHKRENPTFETKSKSSSHFAPIADP